MNRLGQVLARLLVPAMIGVVATQAVAASSAAAATHRGNSEVSSLRHQLSAAQHQLKQLRAQNAALTAAKTLLSRKNASLTSQNSTLSSQNASLTSQNSTLSSQNALLTSQNSTLSSQNASLTSENGTLDSDNTSLNTENTSLDSEISAAETTVGGTGSLAARLTTLDSSLLNSPTGNLKADLATARGLLVATPGSTLQNDIETIDALIGGSAPTTQALIGTPSDNGVISSLSAVIGGSGSIATRLGDPALGVDGLSGDIDAGSATNNNGLFRSVNLMSSGTNLTDQMAGFISLFDFVNVTNGHTNVTFNVGVAAQSLGDIVNDATGTS